MTDRPTVLFTVPIGEFRDHRFDSLDVDREVTHVERLLLPFGARSRPWAVDMGERGADAVEHRLGEWSSTDPGNSILYWIGHGWTDGRTYALAHARSPFHVRWRGVSPEKLAAVIGERGTGPAGSGAWTVVVIDACQSSAFAKDVVSHLAAAKSDGRVLIVGVSGDGQTKLGEFTRILDRLLRTTFSAVSEIRLDVLGLELRHALTGSYAYGDLDPTDVLRREPQFLRVPLDVRAELQRILERLTPDERQHFLPKAQSAETGEVMWYFQGREREIGLIVDFLHRNDRGLLVVTGDPGSGKSALLGQVLTYSQPELRELLLKLGRLKPVPSGTNPPDRAFTAPILLTGASLADLVGRLAAVFGLDVGPDADDADDQQIERLRTGLADRAAAARAPITLLFDALDEAADPVAIARRLLVPISRLPRVRVVVGTRRSLHDGPDLRPAADRNLVDLLLPGGAEPLTLRYDADAVADYVSARLAAHESEHPGRVKVLLGMLRERRREFLYARLVVHEVRADPALLDPRQHPDLAELLGRDYAHLFSRAVDRLVEQAPANRALLLALSIAKGRGLPVSASVWDTVAAALAEPGERIADDAVDVLLGQAAPYVMVDVEAGQTVYRLAHRTFVELLAPLVAPDHRTAVTRALLAGPAPDPVFSPYLVRHLADHAADTAEAWQLLGAHPAVVDRLDPDSIGAHALSPGLGHPPPAIAGTTLVRDRLAGAALPDRAGLRQLGMAQLGHPPDAATDDAAWTLRWAAVDRRVLHTTVGRHTDEIYDVTVVTLPGGGDAVASTGSDRMLRLWDPHSARSVDGPWTGYRGPAVRALAAVHRPGAASLLVCGGVDGSVVAWDLGTHERQTWHAGGAAILSLAAGGGVDGPAWVVSAASDGTVRVWRPDGRQSAATRAGAILSLVTFATPDGGVRVVSATDEGAVWVWDPASDGGGVLWRRRHEVVRAVTPLRRPDGTVAVVTGSSDGVLRLLDPGTGQPSGPGWEDPTSGPVDALTTVAGADGRAMVVSAGSDAALRLWDPARGRLLGRPWTGHTEKIAVLAGLRREGRAALVVSAADDGTVRLWDPASGPDAAVLAGRETAETLALATVAGSGAPNDLVLTGGGDGVVRLWDARDGRQIRSLAGHTDAALSLAVLTGDRAVSAGRDYTLRLWDLGTGECRTVTETGAGERIVTVAAVTAADGRALVVSGGADYALRLWDPVAGVQLGEAWTGHLGAVWTLTAVPGPGGSTRVVSGAGDGTLRLWEWNTEGAATVGEPWRGHVGWVRAAVTVEWPAVGAVVVSGGTDGRLRMWHAGSGAPVAEPWDTGSGVIALAAGREPDGRLSITCACEDATVRRWDPVERVETGRAQIGHPVRAVRVVDGLTTLATDQGVIGMDWRRPL